MSQKIETKIGSLAELVPQFKPETCLTSAELANEIISSNQFEDQTFYTANFALYAVEDGNAILYFGGKKNNPIFNNAGEASKQLIQNGNYTPSKKEMESAKGNALRMNLEDLCLKRYDNESSYIEVYPNDYDCLKITQRLFVESIYGKSKDFVANMKMFVKAGINNSRIYVLNPVYIKEKVQEDSGIARACWLNLFNPYSLFCADYQDVNCYYALRGAIKVPQVTDAQKIITVDYNSAYQTLLTNPQELDDEKATGLSKLFAEYLIQKKK